MIPENQQNSTPLKFNLPPPPPPPLPPPPLTDTTYQYFRRKQQLALLNGEPQYAGISDQVDKKCQQLKLKVEGSAKQTQYPTSLNINLTLYKLCVRCDRWVHQGQFAIHLTCHAAIIKQWLLLGDRFCSTSRKQLIERLNVSYIVNAANQLPNFLEKQPQNIQFIKLGLYDNLTEDPLPELHRAVQFIKMAHDNNKKVFVHCNVGKSRSVSAILLYLLIHQNISIIQGLKIIKKQRSIAQPNVNYMKRLKQFQQSIKDPKNIQ